MCMYSPLSSHKQLRDGARYLHVEALSEAAAAVNVDSALMDAAVFDTV